MRKFFRPVLFVPLAFSLVATPLLAQSNSKRETSEEEKGVQEAIAYQRAKDRADARQARLEAKHPEHFTYAQPQQNPPDGLATAQRREAARKSPKNADHKQGTADREQR